MKHTLLIAALAAILPALDAQTTVRQTTLSAAVLPSDTIINVTSATGIEVGDIAFVNKEAMQVRSINVTALTVLRGYEGVAGPHASGSLIYVDDKSYFSSRDRNGPCVSTSENVMPVVNIASGKVWNCLNSVWTEIGVGEQVTRQSVGTAGTGVTVTEYGTDRTHITKLTFSALALGSGATASLGFGKLLYTLPTGAHVINAASYSISLAGSGAGCDADTPEVGLGTVIASGAVKVLSGTATFEDISTGIVFDDVNGTAISVAVGTQNVRGLVAAKTIHLNAADDWAGACAVTATGQVSIWWTTVQTP